MFRNYVPNKYITIDDKGPVWMNATIKNKMKVRKNLLKQYIQNGRFESDFILIERLGNELSDLICQTKALYYEKLAREPNNPLLPAKTYWLILKTFYKGKKVSLIPPVLIDDKFITDIKTKANIFNKFFADQCTPLKNNDILTTNQIFLTQARLEFLEFNEGEILKIIRALNINKAHGHDDISTSMIKICNKSLLKPLTILFKNSSSSCCYHDI